MFLAGMESPDKIKIAIFIDNSNLWIEGKKAYAIAKEFDVLEDSRWRIDMGKLLRTILDDRLLAQKPFLCGSIPPPVDSVWKNFEGQGVEVKTFNRSGFTGKEKQVDTALVARSVRYASQPQHIDHVVVFLSGDTDMKPAIDEILEIGLKVEVWSWSHSISGSIQEQEGLSVILLDDYLDAIGHLETKWKGTVGSLDQFPVIVIEKGLDMDADVISNQLEQLLYPAWTYQLYQTDLAIIFSVEPDHDYLVALVDNSKGSEVVFHHWLDFKQRKNEKPENEVELIATNQYFVLSHTYRKTEKQRQTNVVSRGEDESKNDKTIDSKAGFERVGKKKGTRKSPKVSIFSFVCSFHFSYNLIFNDCRFHVFLECTAGNSVSMVAASFFTPKKRKTRFAMVERRPFVDTTNVKLGLTVSVLVQIGILVKRDYAHSATKKQIIMNNKHVQSSRKTCKVLLRNETVITLSIYCCFLVLSYFCDNTYTKPANFVVHQHLSNPFHLVTKE